MAPCAVYFDAQSTTSTLTSRPFHELLYQWNFGDPVAGGAGTCTDGNPVAREAGQGSYCTGVVTGTQLDSKNYAEGPEAAHVFETAGTFTVTLTASQGDSNFNNNLDTDEFKRATVTITVSDPNTVFAGNTVCIANGVTPSAGSGGCPAGAFGMNASAASSAITTALASGCGGSGCRRLLFRRGDTFSMGSGVVISAAGPGLIGAYGTGSKPVMANTGVQFRYEADDWRFVDIRQEMGNTDNAAGVYSWGSATAARKNVLLLRVDARGGQAFQTAGSTIGSGVTSGIWDGIFIFDSTCKDLNHAYGNGDNCYYITGFRVAAIGNHIDMDQWSEHGIRTYAQRSVISHNTTEDIASGRSSITQRSFDWGSGEGIPAGTYSGTGIQSLNREIGNGASGSFNYMLTNQTLPGRCQNVIFERNYITNAGFDTMCSAVTFRNNIVRLATRGNVAVKLTGSGLADYTTPTPLFIYNNTIYSNYSGDARIFYGRDGSSLGTADVYLRNNLIYAPNDNSYDPGLTILFSVSLNSCASCNTGDTGEIRANPQFSISPPVSVADYMPQTGSYANGRGVVVPVWNDFYGKWQPGSRDIGAINR